MVLPTTELASTLNPFTVLLPEEDEGSQRQQRRGGRGGAGENNHGKFDVNGYKKCNTISAPPSAHRRNRQAAIPQPSTYSTYSRVTSRVQSLSPPPILPIIEQQQRTNETEGEKKRCSDNDAATLISQHLKQQKDKCISGTTTLDEKHENENEIERRLAAVTTNELSHLQNNHQNHDDHESHDGSNNKILNLLNARNSSFLSNTLSNNSSSTVSYKLSEDDLFTDLKSRFIEKHFRTILRSQQSKESRIFGGGGNSGNNNAGTLPIVDNVKIPKNGNNGATKDSSGGCATLLKSLRFVTVERPEPTLDLPRSSYFKSTKQKFLKMYDQAKLRVAERYRKLCVSLRTTVWPQLYPLQVLGEVVLSNICMMFVAPFAMCAVMLLCLVRMCVGAVLKIRYKGRYHLMGGADSAWAHQSFANDNSFLSLYVVQGDCNIKIIRERVMKSVINCQDPQYPGKYTYSRLKCRIIEKFGFYCWECLHPMDFCIDDHVRYITNDPSAVLTQEQVLREIQKFADQPLPEDQPQWQILVVPKFLYNRDNYPVHDDLEDDGFGNFDTITVKKKPANKNNNFYTGNHYYALVWRINHAIMDGISAANCLQHCIADMPVKLTVDPLQKVPFPLGERLLMYLKMLIFGSRTLLQSMLQRDLNCFHGPKCSGPKHFAWSKGINLQAVKTVKKRNEGATVTAVLAAAVGGALKGLALRKNNPVPAEIRAGVTCALLPYPDIQPQNRFTVAHLKLRLNPDSHKDRLLSAIKAARDLVGGADIYKNYGLIRMIGLVPKKAIPWFMDNCEATVLISNIPGPMEEYTIFQGQKLVDIIGWNTIKGNTAIGVCLFSYAGRLRAGVIADSAVLPSSTDVPSLIEELEKDIVTMAKDVDLNEKDVFMDAL